MARRRRWGNSRTQGAVPTPKPAKAVKMPKPNYKELTAAYKKFVSGNIETRIQALYEAINWWDASITYFLSQKPMEVAQLKTYETANKARALGFGGMTEGERETGLLTAVKMYEKIWGPHHKVPSFTPFIEKYRQNRAALEASTQALQSRYTDLTEGLNSAFAGIGMRFAVQKSEVARELDGNGTILISHELSKVLVEKAKTEGMLSVLFSEAVTAIKAASVEADADGRHFLNAMKVMTVLPNLLQDILKYCDTVPRSKVFKSAPESLVAEIGTTSQGKVRVPKAPKDPNAPRTPRPSGFKRVSAEALVGGRYTPGTSGAILYQALEDQKEKPLQEVYSKLSVGNPADRMRWLVKHGIELGKWSIKLTATTVQMTLKP